MALCSAIIVTQKPCREFPIPRNYHSDLLGGKSKHPKHHRCFEKWQDWAGNAPQSVGRRRRVGATEAATLTRVPASLSNPAHLIRIVSGFKSTTSQSQTLASLFLTHSLVTPLDCTSMVISETQPIQYGSYKSRVAFEVCWVWTKYNLKTKHLNNFYIDHQFSSVAQSCLNPCDPMNHSTPGLPIHHQLLESTQTHVHWVSDAIEPPHLLSSPFPPALNSHNTLDTWGYIKYIINFTSLYCFKIRLLDHYKLHIGHTISTGKHYSRPW